MVSSLQYTPAEYALRRRAYSMVSSAMRTGVLVRQPCSECGYPFGEGHHPDYANPLDLVWLCGACHRDEHNRLRAVRKLEQFDAWCREHRKEITA